MGEIFVTAVFRIISAFRSYKQDKSLTKICNIFPSVHENRLIITATSTSGRVVAHEIEIAVGKFFQCSTYSLTQHYIEHMRFENGASYDAIFPTLFERGLVSGESYEFPIAKLFDIATNRIVLRKEPIGLRPEELVVGQKIKITFMFNGQPESYKFALSQSLLNEVHSRKTTFTDFKLRTS